MRTDFRAIQAQNDIVLDLNYKFRVHKKFNTHLKLNFDIGRSLFYQKIIGYEYEYHLDNVILKKIRGGIGVGLSQEFWFKNRNDIFIDFGAQIYFKTFVKDKEV